MSEILLRVELHTEEQATAAMRQAWPWAKEQLRQGRALVAEYRLLDDAITNAQRGYLHAVVFPDIARQAVVNGQRFDAKTWKEWYRSEFLGFDVVTSVDPFTGRKLRRRVRKSTEDLGVRGMIDYIDRVIAHASTELGVTVSEPLPPHLRPQRRRKQETVDQDTGEILNREAVAA
jgi:hypothetical protein